MRYYNTVNISNYFESKQIHKTSNIRLAENHYRLSMKEILAEGLDKEDGPVIVWTFPDGTHYPVAIKWQSNHLIVEFPGGEGRRTQHICLSNTPCNYGGVRNWFVCPGCSARSSVLYGDPMFRCRSCVGLLYASQYESPRERLRSKIAKLRRKMGSSANPLEPLGLPPAVMSGSQFMKNVGLLIDLQEALRAETQFIRAWAKR